MTLIAEFSFPAESFALQNALATAPAVVVDAGQLVAHSPDTTMPCLWASSGGLDATADDLDAFDDALARDPTIESVRATAEFEDERLFHVDWAEEVEAIVAEMVDHDGVILRASGSGDRWRLRVRFVKREQFDAFQSHFAETGHEMHLEQLLQDEGPRRRRGTVTPEQYSALTTATDLGYFAVPRESSLRDVAAEIDVSHQAASERIRRGTANLVRDALLGEPRLEAL